MHTFLCGAEVSHRTYYCMCWQMKQLNYRVADVAKIDRYINTNEKAIIIIMYSMVWLISTKVTVLKTFLNERFVAMKTIYRVTTFALFVTVIGSDNCVLHKWQIFSIGIICWGTFYLTNTLWLWTSSLL